MTTDMPRLIVVDRAGVLPSGARYVLSFVELLPTGVVVRFHGLTDGAAQRIADTRLELRDDLGTRYPWRATETDGMVLPQEVLVGFDGTPSTDVEALELLLAGSVTVLERVDVK